jgi:hypothetical protein
MLSVRWADDAEMSSSSFISTARDGCIGEQGNRPFKTS